MPVGSGMKNHGFMISMAMLLLIARVACQESPMDFCIDDMTALNDTNSLNQEHINEVALKYNLDPLGYIEGFGFLDFCHDAVLSTPAFIKPKVWIASLISMTIISAVGLLGVAVVPLVQKAFFNSVIQYLVAVAVGTLTGDAFLHLMPHSLSEGGGHTHGPVDKDEPWLNDERVQIFKALVALGGIYFFFLAEKAVSMFSESRAERKADEEEKKRIAQNPRKSIAEGASSGRRSLQARRASGLRKPSISLQVPGDQGPLRRGSKMLAPMGTDCTRQNRALSIVDDSFMTIGLSSRAMKDIENLYRFAEQSDESGSEDAFESESKDKGDVSLAVPQIDFKNKEKEAGEEKKGHGHGHSHEIPDSILSVAWMVILGDGLHNFTDGLAIGAAFAKSTTGGISTSVAVFCHELPHELGDFAVLLKTGMKIKQAMYFNMVSSVLAFIGMIIGIFLGTIEGINTWIFLFTAGTFIYIALVDMLPQLTGYEVRVDESRITLFILQNIGLLTGCGIMLLIALFEEQMMNMLG